MKAKKSIIDEIKDGKIFVYPTDTIYGLGCNATNEKSVGKIKEIKGRDRDKPLSVIAPSMDWIEEKCKVDVELSKYLPGPFTVILKKKKKDYLKHVSKGDSIGIRIPDIEFTKLIQDSGKPFITTSVNLSGESPIVKINELPKEIKDKIDVIVDIGKLSGKPSTLVIDGKEVERK